MKKIFSFLLWLFLVLWLSAINTNFTFGQQRAAEVGVKAEWDCLMWMWQDCFEYETMIWIKDYQPGNGYTATSVVQDVVLAATYIVWWVLTLVIIVCWLWYIFSSTWGKGLLGKDPSEYKKWLIYGALWAILVRWAYAIVRLIQYIARW